MILLDARDVLVVAERVLVPDDLPDLRHAYQERLATLQRVRRGVADAGTSRRQADHELDLLRQRSDRLRLQAALARTKGREDLAQYAERQRARAEEEVPLVVERRAELVGQEERLVLTARRLQAKVERFRYQAELVRARHTLAIARSAANLGLADVDAIEAALAETRAASQAGDLAVTAATLLSGLLRRRPFEDRNRVIALAATLYLLGRNGQDLDLGPAAEVDAMLDTVVRGDSVADLADQFRSRLRPRSTESTAPAG